MAMSEMSEMAMMGHTTGITDRNYKHFSEFTTFCLPHISFHWKMMMACNPLQPIATRSSPL